MPSIESGRHLEMTLFDCGLLITSYYGLQAQIMDEDLARYGNVHPNRALWRLQRPRRAARQDCRPTPSTGRPHRSGRR